MGVRREAAEGTEPRFVDFESAYDQVGNPLWIRDNVLRSSSGRSFDRKPTYDSLRRVTSLDEGELNSGATGIDIRSRYEGLTRAFNGRIGQNQVDLDGNEEFTDGPPGANDLGEMDDLRDYNKRNELRSRTVTDYASGGVPAVIELDYDRNGNLTSDGQRHRYVFNPFGQLVRILDMTSEPVAEFAYSGLGHRISEKTDVNDAGWTGVPDGTLDGDDPVFYVATDPQGRRVATFRGTDAYPKETFVWTPAGVSGPGGSVGGALILRDRDAEACAPGAWATSGTPEARGQRHYYCSDSRLSVVALVGLRAGPDGPTGTLVEQYRYSATGVPYGIPLGDVNGNFQVEVDGEVVVDSAIIADLEQEAVYQVRADLDLDGLVDSDDIAIADAAAGAELGRGRLSMPSVGSRFGHQRAELLRTGGLDTAWATRDAAYLAEMALNLKSDIDARSTSVASSKPVPSPGCAFIDESNPTKGQACPVTMTLDGTKPAPAPASQSSCQDCVDNALMHDATVRDLMRRIANLKCAVSNLASMCTSGNCGGNLGTSFPQRDGSGSTSVRICINPTVQPGYQRAQTNSCEYFTQVLRHELTHAVDYCSSTPMLPPPGGSLVQCMEMRACMTSGQCRVGTSVDNVAGESQMQCCSRFVRTRYPNPDPSQPPPTDDFLKACGGGQGNDPFPTLPTWPTLPKPWPPINLDPSRPVSPPYL